VKDTLLNAGITLFIAALGAGWAYSFYKALWVLVAIPIALAVIGQLLFIAGKGRIRTHPKAACKVMEWGILGPLFLAVIGAGGVILVAVKFAPGEKATPEEKGIITALSGAVVAAITSVLVGKSESPWVRWVDTRISRAFGKAFAGYFEPLSPPHLAALSSRFQGQGWGRSGRKARVEVIADAIRNGTHRRTLGGSTP
jgi:hypothetical protein